MKGVLVKTTGETQLTELEGPLKNALDKTVGGEAYWEFMPRLPKPYLIARTIGICALPVNEIATYFKKSSTSTDRPILGDIVIVKHGADFEQPVDLDDSDIAYLAMVLDDVKQALDAVAKEKAALQCG